MTPARIAIGLLFARVRAGAMRGCRLLVAMVLSVALLAACAATEGDALQVEGAQPIEQAPPVSALRMYEAGVADGKADGRRAALDDLRAQPVFANPIDLSVCPDKVSWLPRKLDIPEDIWIGSRRENMDLKKVCRDGEIEKARIIRRQREAVEAAK